MKKYIPTISLLLIKNAKKKSGKSPLKLIVYCSQQKRRFNIRIDLTEEEWKLINQPSVKDKHLKEIKIKINAITTKANQIIEGLVPFSFQRFKDAFYENATNLKSLDLDNLFDRIIKFHIERDCVSTAISYRTTINSIRRFKKNLTLLDLTPNMLLEYENYLLGQGKTCTTVGIYMRQIRAVFNEAISKTLISRDDYPFGRNKYIIPGSRNIKKALDFENIQRILNFKPNDDRQRKAVDFWIFSYLSNGMSFCDIAKLKWDNITDDFIYYFRSKTRRTKKYNAQPTQVPIHPRALEIIVKYGNRNEEFIFPVLKTGMTSLQIKYKIQDFIKENNITMEKVRCLLEINQSLNTYSCRHSFASVLKLKNVSIEFISESLAHASISTTTAYLNSFQNSTKIEISKLLTTF